MLKKSASIVLASFRPSTYPRGYASGLHSLRPCWTAFLSILQECFPVVAHVRTIEFLASNVVFPQPAGTVMIERDRAGHAPQEELLICSDVQRLTGSEAPCDSSLMIDPGALSVDSGRIRYVLKESIGQIAAKVEPFRQSGRSQEPPRQVTQPRIAGGDELWHVTRRCQPEAP